MPSTFYLKLKRIYDLLYVEVKLLIAAVHSVLLNQEVKYLVHLDSYRKVKANFSISSNNIFY